MEVVLKTCKGCGETKPLDAFHKCATVRDGRKSRCAECLSAASRKWRAENPEKAKASVDSWRNANSERYRSYVREADRQRRIEKADQLREYRAKNRERIAANLAAWKSENRETVRDYERKRRAAVRGSDIGEMDLAGVWAKSGGRCVLCDDELDRSIEWPDPLSVSLDHIVPLSRGGAHVTENARYVHLICNMRKNNRLDNEMTSTVLP